MEQPKVAQKAREQEQEERRRKGSLKFEDGNRRSLAASKQSQQGLLQQSGLCPMLCYSNHGIPPTAPRPVLFQSPPQRANKKHSFQPRLPPWPAGVLPLPSSIQPVDL